jgi:DNA-binding NarL/FixJ family response regulator
MKWRTHENGIQYAVDGSYLYIRVPISKLLPRVCFISPLSPLRLLTNREKQVVNGLLERKYDKEIAEELQVSPRTVKFHVGSIFQKLNLHSRGEVVFFVEAQQRAGLVSPRAKNVARKC